LRVYRHSGQYMAMMVWSAVGSALYTNSRPVVPSEAHGVQGTDTVAGGCCVVTNCVFAQEREKSPVRHVYAFSFIRDQ